MEGDQPIKKKQTNTYQKIFFFILGVSSLSGWNAVLAGLNYFNDQFAELKHNIFFIFPIPNFVALCIIGLFLPRLSLYFSLQFRIAWSLIALAALLIVLPLIAAIMENTSGGYYFSLITIFVMGIFGGFQQNSSIGMAGLLGPDYVNIFFLGTGASGTIICIFRFISLAALSENQGYSALLYCGVAAVWNVVAAVLFFTFKNTPQYRKILKAHKKGKQSVLVHDEIITDSGEDNNLQSDILGSEISLHLHEQSNSKSKSAPVVQIEKMNVFHTLIWINKMAFPIPLLILGLYVQTFLMFPGVAFQKVFEPSFADWGQNLINFGYNFGDTTGKFLAGNRKLYNQTILMIIMLLRFVFYYFYIEIALGSFEANWFSYFNTFLFAVLNGYVTTGLMILGPEKAKEGFVKEKIGFISGFSLQFGIMAGTFLALPFAKLNQ